MGNKQINLKNYTLIFISAWTIFVAIVLSTHFKSIKDATTKMATNEARTHISRDQAFRYWGASHGGVYVPVTKRTEPNIYLEGLVDERDIETPAGKKLTLMNPAYMVRQMSEYYSELYGIGGHITSLKLLNPDNAPTPWEREALMRFENGDSEALEIIDDKLHFMIPLLTRESCLKCHGNQGYKVGDVRGGISVEISLAPYYAIERAEYKTHIISYSILWFLGAIGIFFGLKRLNLNIWERDSAYAELNLYKTGLEQLVDERTKALKNANNSLEETIKEVELANTELKRFTDMVSHDLKNPITSILGMSELLMDRYDDKLDEMGKNFLHRISANTALMNELIDDLLELSRIGSVNVKTEEIEISDIIIQIRLENQKQIADENITIVFDENIPKVRYSKIRLYQLFSNLIKNAIKFSRDDLPLKIEIGVNSNEEEFIFYIKDNGIGISPENREKIFEMFSRLKVKEVDGTGVGLAIVKKIIAENKGRLWVESEVNRGATFFFTVLKKQHVGISHSRGIIS